jgi:hypothetical protein
MSKPNAAVHRRRVKDEMLQTALMLIGAAMFEKVAASSRPSATVLLGDHDSSSSVIYSHISFWCNQMGSAFLRMNSSTSIPSMVGGRLTRFCFPLIKMVMYSFCRRFFSAFSAAVSFRLRFAMMDISLFFTRSGFAKIACT